MESAGRLAGPELGPLRYATISGSHANMVNRSLLAGMDCGGHSLSAVPQAWRKAIQEGVEWQVIKRQVLSAFPSLIDYICQSGNSIQAISKAEDELQLMQKILSAIKSYNGQSAVKWADISAAVLRSRPKCAPSAPGIFAFVLKYGGSEKLLQATEVHVRNFGRANRELGQEVWTILSQDVKNVSCHLRWRHMLLKFAYCNAERPLSATDATWMSEWNGLGIWLACIVGIHHKHVQTNKGFGEINSQCGSIDASLH